MSRTKISSKLRAEIINRDNQRCQWCGRNINDGIKLEVDHIVPENFGGSTTKENLGTLCNECNNGKSSDYYGNYLLMTLIEIEDIDNKLLIEQWPIPQNDTIRFRYSLKFLKKTKEGFWSKEHIDHIFEIDRFLYSCDKDESAMIEVDLIKERNNLLFKNKIRDFLIKNKGYFKELNGKIIFREKK